MSPPVNDSITNEPVNQGDDPVPHIEAALEAARAQGLIDAPPRILPIAVLEGIVQGITAEHQILDALPSVPVAGRAEFQRLTVEVTLNTRDSEAVRALAEEEYRTPAQQVGYIVHQWFDLMRKAGHGGAVAPQPAALQATPPPAEPRLIPVYHRGDGSAGSGCGKVGLLFARPLEGKTIGVGDVFKTDETPWTKEDGPLTCCQCGGAMVPSTWTYEL